MKRLAKLAARGAGASLALALAVVALRGCSSGEDDAAEPTDAGAEETSLDAPAEAKPSDAPVSDGFAGSGGSDGNVDCPGPIPDDVPTGWVKVPVAACWYDLYGPPDASLLPKGLKWQECSDLGPSTYTCRELVVDWQDEAGTPVGGIPYAQGIGAADFDEDGHLDLVVTEGTQTKLAPDPIGPPALASTSSRTRLRPLAASRFQA